jgi:hypothetical protein
LPNKYSCLHDVFPVQLLEDYHQREGNENEGKGPLPDLIEEQEEWEVQEICNAQKFNRALHYLIKWTGWPSEYDSWEPAKHLAKASRRVHKFEKKQKQGQR